MNTTSNQLSLLDQWFFVQKVVSDPRLARCAVACAFYLIDYYNDNFGRAWPSYDTLAKLTNSNRRTVITAVKKLLELGYFTVEKGAGRRSNYYRPNFALAKKDSEQPAGGDEQATSPVAQTSPLQGVMVNSSPPNTSYIPVVPNGGDKEVSPRSAGSVALGAPSPSRGAPPGFGLFWQAYPRKEGRRAALTAYSMALQRDGVTPELLASKAAQYAEAKAGSDPKWIKMPRTWLDDECWLEDPQPPKSRLTKGRSRGGTAKTDGAAEPTSKWKSNSPVERNKKPKATPAPKRSRRRETRKRRAPSRTGKTTHFGENVLRYCEYLGITPQDISCAMGLNLNGIQQVCYGRRKIPNRFKDQIRSLLIDAVRHHPEDQTLTVEWLRDWYECAIKDQRPNLYEWKSPRHYQSLGPN